MKPVFKSLIVAGLLATAGFAAYSQGPGGGGMMDCDGGGRMGHMNPERMEKMMARRAEDLKAKLKITPAQEGAWTAFTASMKPSADMMGKRPDTAELAKLTTPERIDKMHALRAQRTADMNAAMDKREEATKTFYAALNADQKKVFDAEHASMGDHGHWGSHHGPMGPHDGSGAPAAPKQ
ncbi:MAG: Spy/CpxP family protein refolding chaperone [Burkholderiales bacterium]|nr:Spy/CpxP family protein refolding chaperone [Burkholderiales bacterium]